MSSTLLLKKLHLTDIEFVNSDEIKSYCLKLNLSYEKVIKVFCEKRLCDSNI